MKRKVFNLSLLVGIGLLAFGVTGLSACSTVPNAETPHIKLDVSSFEMSVGQTKKLNLSVQKHMPIIQ